MAKTKFICPPPAAVGTSTFSDNLVGLQLVGGGGLTLGNFQFTTAIGGKNDRSFTTGVFSDPFNLETLKIPTIEQAKLLVQKNFQVYPNFDLSQITSFSLYGSLQKRLSTSITKIINYFPAAIQVNSRNLILQTGNTAYNIVYDGINDETIFSVDVDRLTNPFMIDYSISAATNILAREIVTSPLRNLNSTYLDYCVAITNTGNTSNPYDIFKVLSFEPSDSLATGTLTFYVS